LGVQAASAYPIVAAGEVLANRSVALAVQGPAEALGPSLVKNPGFDDTFPWRVTSAAGSRALAAVDRGSALLRASQPPAAATVSVSQQLAFPEVKPYRLSYRAIDQGANATRFTVLLREAHVNGTTLDTRFTHVVPSSWTTFNWTWTPRGAGGRSVTLFLQTTAPAGTLQELRVDDVTLTPVARVTWEAPGGVLRDSDGPRAHVAFLAKGEQVVYANATDGGVPLWSAVGRFSVRNAAPEARLAPQPSVPLNRPATFDATPSLDADAPLALADPAFAALGTVWRTHGPQVGRSTSVVADPADPRGAVDIEVLGAVANTTAFLSQDVPLGATTAARLTVWAQDSGDVQAYSIILRESTLDGTTRRDTAAAFPPAGLQGQVLQLPWTRQLANATTLTVLLRFRVEPGGDAHVLFAQPRLLSGLTFAWSLDGQAVQRSGVPTLGLLPRAAGPHLLAVNVSDEDGAWSVAAMAVNYTDAGFAWDTPPPAVAPLAPALDLGLASLRRTEGREEQLQNGGFSVGTKAWGLTAGAGMNASWVVVPDPGGAFARVRARATQEAAVALGQDTGRLCAQVACSLSFDYRSDAPLDVVLRERNGTADPIDTHVAAPASAQWRHVAAAWHPTPQAERMTVLLRAVLEAGRNATLDFRAVGLEPALAAAATVTGPGATVNGSSLRFAAPGLHALRVTVANPYGQAGVFERTVRVLPATLFPTLDGRLGVRILGPAAGSIVVQGVGADAAVDLRGGPADPDAFVRDGARYVRVPAPPDGRVLLQADGQEGVLEVRGLLAAFAALPQGANATAAASGWNTVAHVRVAAPDEALLEGTARILEGSREVARVALARSGPDLVGQARLPLSFAAHDYTVAYTLRDGWGDGMAVAPQSLHAGANPQLWGGLALLAGALVAGAAGLAYSRAQRRGGAP
jgi:hypothetical protein